MADTKISALTESGTVASDDEYVIVDTSGTETKRITLAKAGGKFLIEEITLTSGAPGEFDFDNIPGVFNRLVIEVEDMVSEVSGTTGQAVIVLNTDDTASNYRRQNHLAGGGTPADQSAGDNKAFLIPASGSPANSAGSATIAIQGYTGGHLKMIDATFVCLYDTGSVYAGRRGVASSITAAITRIRIRTDNHPTDQLYGTARLYGEF